MQPQRNDFVERGSHWILDLVEHRGFSAKYIWGSFFVILVFDWLTGYELSFDFFYLLPIGLAGIGYGWRLSFQVALCAVAFDLINGLWGGYSFSQPFYFYFSVFNKLLSYSAFVAITEMLRHALLMQMQISDTDALTRLLNRRALNKVFATELLRMRRSGNALGILLIDCDNFKDINDQLGHPVGDLVLKNVADVLSMHLREIDHTARFGGDEFVVLLPDSTTESTMQVAEKLKSVLLLSMEQKNWPMTFSIGVHVAQGEDPGATEAFLSKADLAMYAAKKEGKNRIVAI